MGFTGFGKLGALALVVGVLALALVCNCLFAIDRQCRAFQLRTRRLPHLLHVIVALYAIVEPTSLFSINLNHRDGL
jgi:hypothetical protein